MQRNLPIIHINKAHAATHNIKQLSISNKTLTKITWDIPLPNARQDNIAQCRDQVTFFFVAGAASAGGGGEDTCGGFRRSLQMPVNDTAKAATSKPTHTMKPSV